ncbi:MAG: DUF4296 domain-containing protein [Bacteroidota bacterium]
MRHSVIPKVVAPDDLGYGFFLAILRRNREINSNMADKTKCAHSSQVSQFRTFIPIGNPVPLFNARIAHGFSFRMMKLVPILFLFSLLVSCRDELGAIPKPVGLISEDKMVDVLTELTVIEAHIQMNYLQVAKYKQLMERSGDVVLAKYGIKRTQFDSSLDYYGSRQEKMQELYARVLDSLNLMSGRIVPPRDSRNDVKPKADSSQRLPGIVRITLDKDK